jgi:hypothetical protein
VKRLFAGLSAGVAIAAVLVVAGPVTQAGAVTLGYSCGAGFALKVTVTGVGSVNTLEEPTERFMASNVVFKIANPFSTPMTINNVRVRVADPPTVSFVSGSTLGAGWVFTHPGISTDTHASSAVIPVAGSLASGPMRMRYRDVSTDPTAGPGFVQWFGGSISLNVVSPPGIGAVTCTPIPPVAAFAAAKDPV